jgi:hypothetical protein
MLCNILVNYNQSVVHSNTSVDAVVHYAMDHSIACGFIKKDSDEF